MWLVAMRDLESRELCVWVSTEENRVLVHCVCSNGNVQVG